MAREKGVVKWFDKERGFGFITPDDGERDVFVHYTEIEPEVRGGFKNLIEGDRVEYDVTPTLKGPQAENVIKLS